MHDPAFDVGKALTPLLASLLLYHVLEREGGGGWGVRCITAWVSQE